MNYIHLSCQENCWRMVNSMGNLMFVSDNRNQLTKLENFGRKCFSFSRKEKQDDCFFLNKRIFKKENFLLNIRRGKDSYRIKASKRAFQSGVPFLKPWSNVLQSFTNIIFRTILFEFAFYSIHIFKSRLEGVSFYGNLLLFMDKSYRFD